MPVLTALVLAETSGLDPQLVQAALAGRFADSRILQLHGTRMIERRYQPGAWVSTQLKELRLAEALATAAGLELPHLRSTRERYERLVAAGAGNLDHSALHRLLAPATGAEPGEPAARDA